MLGRRGFLKGLIVTATAVVTGAKLPERKPDLRGHRHTVSKVDAVLNPRPFCPEEWSKHIVDTYKDNLVISRAYQDEASKALAKRVDDMVMDSVRIGNG